jgi:hypothetical protein
MVMITKIMNGIKNAKDSQKIIWNQISFMKLGHHVGSLVSELYVCKENIF